MSLRNKNKLHFVSVCLVISLELVCLLALEWFYLTREIDRFHCHATKKKLKTVVILSDPDMAKKALITLNLPKEPGLYYKISSVFGQRAAGQGILTEVDHDAWRLKRAMLEPGFHRKYLMNSMEAFNSICGDFLQNLRKYADGKTPVRMVDEFARVILDIKWQGINC